MVIYYLLTFIRAENVFKGRRPAQSGEFWTCSIPVSTLYGLTYVKVFYTKLNKTVNTMFCISILMIVYQELFECCYRLYLERKLTYITCTMAFKLFVYDM